jgi:hypothetical protein
MSKKYETGKVKGKEIDLDKVDFAIDTALSWEGTFPKPGKGDYLVTLAAWDRESEEVLVSRRYVGAHSAENAAEIALNAYAERHDYPMDDKGEVVEMDIEGVGKGIPCWVERVDAVT